MADHRDTSPGAAPTPVRRPRVRRRPRTPQEARQWRRRMVGYALSGAAFILVVNALVGENGYLATLRARRESAQLEEQLNRLRDENRQMRERIKRLNTDPAELEDSARKELRLIKPGETIVIVKDEKKPAAPQEPGK